jgi:hypothetical protein
MKYWLPIIWSSKDESNYDPKYPVEAPVALDSHHCNHFQHAMGMKPCCSEGVERKVLGFAKSHVAVNNLSRSGMDH